MNLTHSHKSPLIIVLLSVILLFGVSVANADQLTEDSLIVEISTSDLNGSLVDKGGMPSNRSRIVRAFDNDMSNDRDGDGILNDDDNCPDDANADQLDTDSDGEGDACDMDDDNDGVPDQEDAYPLDEDQSVDSTPPQISGTDLNLEGNAPGGVRFTSAYLREHLTVSDDVDATHEIEITADVGETLALGEHEVTFTAADSAGNTSSLTVSVTVVDTTAPSIAAPNEFTINVFSHEEGVAGNPTLVGENATWRYLDDGSDQGTAWRAMDFDDSAWASGPAELGFGDGDEATELDAGHITYYFRHKFDVAAADPIDEFILRFVRDDGAVIYLNNEEIFRSNMPAGNINSNTPASSDLEGADEMAYVTRRLSADSLVDGVNVLAVEVHQQSSASSDLSFKLTLNLLPYEDSSELIRGGSVWRYLDNGSDQGTAWRELDFDDSSWDAGQAQLGFGEDDETTTLSPGHITYYFRHKFNVANPASVSVLAGSLKRDDGAIVYLNGTEIERQNMPASTVNFTTTAINAGDDGEDFHRFSADPDLLMAGENVVAVEVHQSSAASSDVSFDLILQAEASQDFTVQRSAIKVQRFLASVTAMDIVDTDVRVTNNMRAVLRINSTNSVTFRSEDDSGNRSTALVRVVVRIGPELDVPDNIVAVALSENGLPSDASVIQAFLDGATALDEDGNELTVANDAGDSFPVGESIVTFSATDGIGRTATATAIVTIIEPLSTADTDGDGMPDLYEAENQLDPNRDDSNEDADGDGLANILEFQQGKNPAVDDVAPIVTAPSDIRITATGWYTPVDVGEAMAVDAKDGELTVMRDSIFELFRPGVHEITWSAIDAAENQAEATQTIEILPLAQVSPQGRVGEGQMYRWMVSLNGTAPSYPVEIPLTLSGSADAESDYTVSSEASNTILIAEGSTWRYLDDGSDQQTAWREPDFDDSAWSTGAAELGFGDRDEVTELTRGAITFYFRHHFNITDSEAVEGLKLRILRDDGAVVYLNGTEIFRTNMPEGEINATTLAPSAVGGEFESHFETVELTADQLRDGKNVLAVEVHQNSSTSSDVSFNLELAINQAPGANDLVSKGSTWSYLDDGSDLGSDWRAKEFDDSEWATGNAELGFGEGDEATVITRGHITYYFRQEFSVDMLDSIASLTLFLKRDDGAVVYLNGTEVTRDNIGESDIVFDTLASNASDDGNLFHEFTIASSHLEEGNNVLAVEVHQNSITSSDLSFDLQLQQVPAASSVTITAAHESVLVLNVTADEDMEGTETVTLTLSEPSTDNVGIGSQASTNVSIIEDAVPPSLSISVSQGENSGQFISSEGGEVTATLEIQDPNGVHTADWAYSDGDLLSIEGTESMTFSFDPTGLFERPYYLRVDVIDDAFPDRMYRVSKLLHIKADMAMSDQNENGIPDEMDKVPAVHSITLDSAVSDHLAIAERGIKLAAGGVATSNSVSGVSVTEAMIMAGGEDGGEAPLNSEDTDFDYGSGLYDLEIQHLAVPGQSVRIIIPVSGAVPADGKVRLYTEADSWMDFMVDENNTLGSSEGTASSCPEVGSEGYSSGLTKGNHCLELMIEDGGANDADGEANGIIDILGGIGAPASN